MGLRAKNFLSGHTCDTRFGRGGVKVRFGRKSCFSTFRVVGPPRSCGIDPFQIRLCSRDSGLSFGGSYSPVAPTATAWREFEHRARGAKKCLGVCSGWVSGKIMFFNISGLRPSRCCGIQGFQLAVSTAKKKSRKHFHIKMKRKNPKNPRT